MSSAQQLGDARIEGGEGEEGLVPEAGEDPALRDLHRHFDFRLVAGLRRTRRQDDGAVVLREIGVGALYARLVAARHDDTALELIGDDGLGDPAEELEGPLVAGDPIGDLLGAGRFGIGVVRGAQDGDEELDREHLAGGGLDDPRLAGPRSRRSTSRRRDGPGASTAPAAGASADRIRRIACSGTRPDAARDIPDGAARA